MRKENYSQAIMPSRVKPAERKAQEFRQKVYNKGQDSRGKNIAYLCMEYGLPKGPPIYSGGLGALAGDTVLSAADLGLPMYALGLLFRSGYFAQTVDNGNQIDAEQTWDPASFKGLIDLRDAISLKIGEEQANFRLWGYEIPGESGEFVPLILLDARGATNPDKLREITSRLYAAGHRERLLQEIALGLGGVEAMGWFDIQPDFWHLNEGHAAFAPVAMLRRLGVAFDQITPEHLAQIRQMFSFTTHTPVEAGFDKFPLDFITDLITDPFLRAAIIAYGRDPHHPNLINMARLAMTLSGIRNGVSILHAEVSERLFPEFVPILPITNGVHPHWVSPPMAKLLKKYCPDWRRDPTQLAQLSALENNDEFRTALWQAHLLSKRALCAAIKHLTGINMREDVFTLCFARRFATYKRGDLLFTNERKLLEIAEELGGLQIVYAGKAHPSDVPGQDIIRHVIEAGEHLMRKSKGKIKFVFLENYDLQMGAILTAGGDVWLNTPLPPFEASGTSGMKAALNAVPTLSTWDGWWCENRGGGWTIGEKGQIPHTADPHLYLAHSSALYALLRTVGQHFYQRATDPTFVTQMLQALAGNGSFFNTHRMAQQYAEQVWFPGRTVPVALPEKPVRSLPDMATTIDAVSKASAAIALATSETEIETILAEAVITTLGATQIARYDAHKESVMKARSWQGQHFGAIIHEEKESERAHSFFDTWRTLKDFEREVMADLVRTGKMEFIGNPSADKRCVRGEKTPFLVAAEFVNAIMRGAYLIRFSGELTTEEEVTARTCIDTLLQRVGEAKARLLIKQLEEDFQQNCHTEQEVLNWALVLMTAGGFVDMPRYAVETNRVAVFLTDRDGNLIGAHAIGDSTNEAYWSKLEELGTSVYKPGVRDFLRQYDQSQGSLRSRIRGINLGPNCVFSPITIQNNTALFDCQTTPGETDTRAIAVLDGKIRGLFQINDRPHTNIDHLLLPITGTDGQYYGMVVVDNAFSRKPLHADRYIPIIEAAVRRIAALRQQAK